MGSTISPNMNLIIPTVGTEPGPTYATDVNNSLTLVDMHDHSNGKGVQITPQGLNINTSLSFNDNFGIDLKGLTLVAQSITPGINTIYESGVDLYYVDGLGNNIQITANGGVAGSPGSISNLTSPASASYIAGSSTFVWQSDTSIAANMDFGSAIFRNLSPNSTFGITMAPPGGLSSNYTLTLPVLPASQKFMTLDNSGNITASWAVDNASLEISSNTLQVKALGIQTSMLAAQAVTAAKITDHTITTTQISNSAGITGTQIANTTISPSNLTSLSATDSSTVSGYTNTTGSFTDVASIAVTAINGRPIIIQALGLGTGLGALTSSSTSGAGVKLVLFRWQIIGTSTVNTNSVILGGYMSATSDSIYYAPSIMNMTYISDKTGSVTIKLQAAASSANSSAGADHMFIRAIPS